MNRFLGSSIATLLVVGIVWLGFGATQICERVRADDAANARRPLLRALNPARFVTTTARS